MPDGAQLWLRPHQVTTCVGFSPDNKDLKPALKAFRDRQGILYTGAAIRHTVLAQGTGGSGGIVVRSLWSFSTMRATLNGVRLTTGQLRNLGLAHSMCIMTDVPWLKVHKWRAWAPSVKEANNVDEASMVRGLVCRNGTDAQVEPECMVGTVQDEPPTVVA